MSNPILEVHELKKHFPVARGWLKRAVGMCRAVDGVSFCIQPGEVVGIVGESGCGKSTLARAAIRLIEPSHGQIRFLGRDLRALTDQQLRRWRPQAQMVFQDPLASLNPRKTVGENVGEAAWLHGVKGDVVSVALERVGLESSMRDRYPHQFSGGQQQRICIARAIALEPKLLVCDEAVSALDVSVQAQILNLLAELKKEMGLSLLFISHDLSVVRHLCDRVLVLYLGKVVESGPTEQLFANPQHPYTQVLLSSIPKEHPRDETTRVELEGDPPSPLDPPSGCPFHPRCPVAEPQCKEAFPPKRSSGSQDYWCVRT